MFGNRFFPTKPGVLRNVRLSGRPSSGVVPYSTGNGYING